MLHLCDACGRHVRLAEACPFCVRGRRGRVIAGVLGLGLLACSPPAAPVYGGPPEPPPPVPDAAAPETAAPESAAPETPESTALESAPPPPVALYGMAPMDIPPAPEKTP